MPFKLKKSRPVPHSTFEDFRVMLYTTLQNAGKRISLQELNIRFTSDWGDTYSILDYALKFGHTNVISVLSSLSDMIELKPCETSYAVALVEQLRMKKQINDEPIVSKSSRVLNAFGIVLDSDDDYPDIESIALATFRVPWDSENDEYYQLLKKSKFASQNPKILQPNEAPHKFKVFENESE